MTDNNSNKIIIIIIIMLFFYNNNRLFSKVQFIFNKASSITSQIDSLLKSKYK